MILRKKNKTKQTYLKYRPLITRIVNDPNILEKERIFFYKMQKENRCSFTNTLINI